MQTSPFLVALLYLLSLLSPPAYAQCNCLWRGSFSDVQAEADLVVSGKVVAQAGNSVDLQINRSLRGKEPDSPIRIWMKTADYCRPEVELFPVGTEWVMALNQIREEIPGGFNPSTPNVSYGRLGDYSLSSCGGYWLSQTNNWVTGNLVNAPRWEYNPKMTPVLLDLVADYILGNLDQEVLLRASHQDPALRELKINTRSFLRTEN